MRMVADFEEPTAGRIRLQGQDVTGVPPNKRDVNMVFQSYVLFPHMNVFENVAFGLRRKGAARDEINRRVGEMLEIVDLGGRGKRRPRELSGGQQQRVALARALVNRPRALLLDEPLGALDLKLRQAMQAELKRIRREVGITFVYVTHDQGEALTMSDRIAVMDQGAVEQLGSPRDIYEHPATRFVAAFIGTSNLLSGTVSAISGWEAVIDLGDEGRIVVPLHGRPAATDAPLELTVRPEKIELVGAPPAPLRLRAAGHRHRSGLPGHLHQLHGYHQGRGRHRGIPAELSVGRQPGGPGGRGVAVLAARALIPRSASARRPAGPAQLE